MTKKARIAGIGDIHLDDSRRGKFKKIFAQLSREADVLCLLGDLTDHGQAYEAEMMLEELESCTIPIVGVLGNHDYDKDMQKEITQILSQKMAVLNGSTTAFAGIHFAGVKGFGGGFAPNMWGRVGEYAQKAFYDESEREAEKLENALTNLMRERAEKKVVLMHYSPVKATLEGDIVEAYPFLGCTRFEEVIDRYPVDAVLHAHSHFGKALGKTTKGAKVYNVSFPLMQKVKPDNPYQIVEV